MNYERRKERHPHLYKQLNIFNELPYEISDEKINEIVEDLIQDNLVNTTDVIEIEVEVNNEEKNIEVEINSEEHTIILEEVKENIQEIPSKIEITKEVVKKQPIKKEVAKKENSKTVKKSVDKKPLKKA